MGGDMRSGSCSRLIVGLLGLLAVFIVSGCSPDGRTNNGAKSSARRYPFRAVATVGMVADIVKQIGRDHLTVTQIMGAGVDPHLYKATRDDVQTIVSADIVFYSGLLLEGKMSDTLEKVKLTKPVYAVTENLSPSYLISPPDNPEHHDPHVWMDVLAWSLCAERIAEVLKEFDPDHAADYQQAMVEYGEQLAALHQYGLASVATIPETSRVLITSHDAFNYFGRAYGLEVLGIQGISTESEAGLRRINELVDLIVSKNIKAVFVESSVSKKNILALIDGARSRGHEVVIGGELYSDAMGPDGSYEGTYAGMLDHNITVVTRALGGQAPERGFHGKLELTTSENHP